MTKSTIYKSEFGRLEILNFYENLLNDWTKPYQEHFIQTKFGETFVIECGKNEDSVIVLLHGSSSNSSMWKADVEEYSKNHRVIVIDIIGECGKSSENRPPFKNNNYAEWLNDIFVKLNVNSAIIVACSLGGWIAINFTLEYPEKTSKLVLLASAGITQVKVSTIIWIIITSMFGKWGFEKLNKMVYNKIIIDKKVLDFSVLIKNYFKPRTDVLPIFSNEQLKSIQSETFFIGGESDCFYNSSKTAARLKENIKLVRCEVLTDTGHVLINQTEKIIDFIKS